MQRSHQGRGLSPQRSSTEGQSFRRKCPARLFFTPQVTAWFPTARTHQEAEAWVLLLQSVDLSLLEHRPEYRGGGQESREAHGSHSAREQVLELGSNKGGLASEPFL